MIVRYCLALALEDLHMYAQRASQKAPLSVELVLLSFPFGENIHSFPLFPLEERELVLSDHGVGWWGRTFRRHRPKQVPQRDGSEQLGSRGTNLMGQTCS